MKTLPHLAIRGAILATAAMLWAGFAHAQATVPLVTFYSPSRGDYFTTSQPEWACKIHGCSGSSDDYAAYGMQGHVFNPDLPRPTGTLPLWHWYSESRGDNFLTTNPEFDPDLGTSRAEYNFVRLAGYIRPADGASPLQLVSFWNPVTADNAALTTAKEVATRGGAPVRVRVPAGYARYRVEGVLLPPPSATLTRCQTLATPSLVGPRFHARGEYIDAWPAPADFLSGDAVQVTAPADTYVIDYWSHRMPVRGYAWDIAREGSGFPAPGIARFALLARVTSGRIYVANQGWFEANQWFRALGEAFSESGACMAYDAEGVLPGDLQFGFNDDNVGDNSGWANVSMRQWF